MIIKGIISFFIIYSSSVYALETVKLRIKQHEVSAEVASNEGEHRRGLMDRKSMPQDQGMLFVFDDERQLSFWMKNTLIPLSIAYIDSKLKIVDIQDMKVVSILEKNVPSYVSTGPAQLALEMNLGWFDKYDIKVGDTIEVTSSTKNKILLGLSRSFARQKSINKPKN